jgi:thiol-disulfide isomerase/thioredoxin
MGPARGRLKEPWPMNWTNLAAAMGALTLALATPVAADPGDLTVVDASGARHALKDLHGKWVLVNYWATWCGACIAEMPALSALAAQEPALSILGVTDEQITPDQLRLFLARHPVSYTAGWSDKTAIPRELSPTMMGVEVRPLSYLIAPDGRVAKRFRGAVDPAKIRRVLATYRR